MKYDERKILNPLNVPSDELKRIFAAAPPTIILQPDSPKFTILYANPACFRVTGTTAEDIVGLGFLEAFPENPNDQITGNVETLRNRLIECLAIKKETILPSQKYDIPIRGTNLFETRYWQASNNPVLDVTTGEVEYIIHATVDITGAFDLAKKERIAFEIAEAQRKELSSVLMEAPAGIVAYDGPDFVFQFANPVYQSFFPGRELLGKPMLEVQPELRGHPVLENLKHTYRTGETFYGKEVKTQFVKELNGPLVDSYWNFIFQARYNETREIDGILMFGFEVTEQVEARNRLEEVITEKTALAKTLKENEQRLQSILDTMAEGLGIVDRKGQMVYANEMAERFLGVQRDEILTRTYNDPKWRTINLDGTPMPDEDHPMAKTMATGLPLYEQLVGIEKPNGAIQYLSINAAPIFDDEGKVSGGIGTLMDVTNRIQSAQQKDEFISTVSHELKTPVTSIKAYAQLLQKLPLAKEDVVTRGFLERMNIQIEQLECLISNLLDITRIDSGKLEFSSHKFEVHLVLAELISDLQLFTPTHKLIITQNQPIKIVGDQSRIVQVFTNLITNAVKYSPGADKVLISLTNDGNVLTCSVQDFGIGIPEGQKKHIFDRFHQAGNNNIRTGLSLGLGLYISKQIIEKLGGRIWFESELGKGSNFHVSFPINIGTS